jgi:tRNA(Ile)-lysidine synthase
MPADLLTALLQHVDQEGLFPDPGLALLAVSGGPDSLALLDLMHRLAPALQLSLVVGHVDHGIAAESGCVAGDVARWAGRYAAPCVTQRLTLGAGASETRARAARYGALRQMQGQTGARYLVTAHHRDDQLETVLLRALKGSGPRGLTGIRARSGDGLTRPLLPFGRNALGDWLRRRYPDPAVCGSIHRDRANEDPRHDRSWLRHTLLPLLRDRFGPRFDDRLLELQRHAAVGGAAWAAALRTLPGLALHVEGARASLSLSALQACPQALGVALLEAAAWEAGCALRPGRAVNVFELLAHGRSGASLELGSGWVAEIVFDRLAIRRAARTPASASVPFGTEASGCATWAGWELAWCPSVAEPAQRASLVTWVTPGAGVIRPPRPGDRLRPLGGVGRRAVRRLLMEARVPRGERPAYPVLSRGSAILWLPGVCRSVVDLPLAGRPAVRLEARRVVATVGGGGDPG